MAMNQTSLKQLYEDHQGKETDKWSLYLVEWDRLFLDFIDKPISLLEIGVQNGGSLEVWSKYFRNAINIVGCDIDENCGCLSFVDPRISVVIGDANSDSVNREIAEKSGVYDIIIDDGSHKSGDIITSFFRYFPLLAEDGIYIVEDLHASYWADFEGGLYNPYSAISFCKRLTDIGNFEHWRNGQTPQSILSNYVIHYEIGKEALDLEKIHSVEFINSLCVIRKAARTKNELGPRVISGLESCVTGPRQNVNQTYIQDMDVRIEDDNYLDVFSLIPEVENLKIRSEALDHTIVQMDGQIQDLNEELGSKTEQITTLSRIASNQSERLDTLDGQMVNLLEVEGKLSGIIQTQRSRIVGLEQDLVSIQSQAKELEQDLKSIQSQAKELEDEVIYYISSKSWKYTRPFRRFYGFLRRLAR